MTSSASLPGPAGDAFDEATRHLRTVAALLTRVFEAFAALQGDSAAALTASMTRDADFWSGLQDLMADLVRTAQSIQKLADDRRAVESSAVPVAPLPQSQNGDGASSEGLARELARDALNVDLGSIIEEHQDDWAALVEAIRTEKFHGDNGARDGVEPLELYSKVITTLPVELRRDFRRLTEWRTADEIAERHAAFELGRQIERHSRTVRR